MKRLVPIGLLFAAVAARAEIPKEFDACTVFTPADAAQALGETPRELPPPKTKNKVIPACTYESGEGPSTKSLSVQFRFAKNDDEARRAFSEARLEARGKPVILGGRDAYWLDKQAQLNVLKGSHWVVITAKVPGRESDTARKLAEILLPKI